ncbi:MAG: hypothetical protein EBZ49_03675 [Proteobacteria bacterium]|nr:hypothetical protein [Pseudomonadota bacterium]
MTKNEWNERCRQSIDLLLAERGFAPDCSIRNQLSCMNFAPISLKGALDALEAVADLNAHGTGMNYETMTKAILEFVGVDYE